MVMHRSFRNLHFHRRLQPVAFLILLLLLWAFLVFRLHGQSILPGPWQVTRALWELLQHGLLFRYVVASLFRVTWGFLLATVFAIPLGLAIGAAPRTQMALNPIVQIFRPLSPLAWIPIAILWFGVGDLAAIFLIFLGCFFPLLATTINAVHNIPAVYLNAGRNFGMRGITLLYRVVYPAAAPQLIVGLRITLGIAWLVVVAAEMIAVNSGLGFLIVDARNAGNRYDLVVAGMVVIGAIGLLLDRGTRALERFNSVQWAYGNHER